MSSPLPPALTRKHQTDECSLCAIALHARLRVECLGVFASAVGFGIDSGVEGQVESGEFGCWNCCCAKYLREGLERDEIVHEPRSRGLIKCKTERWRVYRGFYAEGRKRWEGCEHVKGSESCQFLAAHQGSILQGNPIDDT